MGVSDCWCTGQAWDFFTEAGSSTRTILMHITACIAIVLVCQYARSLLNNCVKMDHPLLDSYILFAKVVNADEPCASNITDLVGYLIFSTCNSAVNLTIDNVCH